MGRRRSGRTACRAPSRGVPATTTLRNSCQRSARSRRRKGVAPDALDGVIVSVGPGGFSALRTGIGVAKGLAVAWSLPVAGVSTLEASAYPYRSTAERICAVLPAGRGVVAWAVYGVSGGAWSALSEEQVSPIADFAAAQSGGTLFCGESAADVEDVLREHMGADARFVNRVRTARAPVRRGGTRRRAPRVRRDDRRSRHRPALPPLPPHHAPRRAEARLRRLAPPVWYPTNSAARCGESSCECAGPVAQRHEGVTSLV